VKRRILFAHGAGAGSQAPWMVAWTEHLGTLGRVTTFDYPYMAAGRKFPGPFGALIEAHGDEAKRTRGRSRAPFVLAGKSMGSRVGCHLSLEVPVSALVCFGYPLVSPSKKKTVRDEVLLNLETPILFIQGTKDRLCPLPHLHDVIERMSAPVTLHVVPGGDHSLRVGTRDLAARGETQEDIDAAVLGAVAAFLAELD